jgi:hypothetical protein
MLSNYSRSFILSFPAPSATLFWNGPSPVEWTGPQYNYLSVEGGSSNAPTVQYTDNTKLNYRQIVIQDQTSDPEQSWIITGMTNKGMVTEIIPIEDNSPYASVHYFSYVTFIGSATTTSGVTIGNGLGYSPWIMHDGSRFSNYVKVAGGAINWTIEGTLDKWNATVSNKFSHDKSARIYDPLAVNIDAALTNQTVTTPYPVSVTLPYEAIRLVITAYPAGTIEYHFASQNI